jgi:hypothetical protein
MASHAAVAGVGVVPVVAAARGPGVTRSALSPSLPRPAVSGVGNADRVRVRFAYAPGAVRASVKVYAESGTLDASEVRIARFLHLNRASVSAPSNPRRSRRRVVAAARAPGGKPQIAAASL